MFAVINAISLAFVIKFVPETGRTLEELEDDFRTHRAAAAPVGVLAPDPSARFRGDGFRREYAKGACRRTQNHSTRMSTR